MAFCEDDFSNIFSRLPAKSLSKFNCVSTASLNFSKDSYFCMNQGRNMLLQDDPCFFIRPNRGHQHISSGVELHYLLEQEDAMSSGVPCDFVDFMAKSGHILASRNGLVLCCRRASQESEVELFICNPITKSRLLLATPDRLLQDPDADVNVAVEIINNNLDVDDYRIILIEKPLEWCSHLDLKVYLPKVGVWEAMEKSFFTGSRSMKLDMPVILRNSLHYISNCGPYIARTSRYFRPYIMAYDFESGKTTMMRLPKDARKGSHHVSCDMGIFEWGTKEKNSNHSICLVRHMKSVFTVWILVDYASTSWRRILKIRLKAMGLEEDDPRIQGFTVMNGNCLVFATERKVYGYNLCGQVLKEICQNEWGTSVCFTSYSNTLRPCGTGATNSHGFYVTADPVEEKAASTSYTVTLPEALVECKGMY